MYDQIGVNFALKVLNWDNNTTIRLQLWDINGQERFGNMTRVCKFYERKSIYGYQNLDTLSYT